jgi:hypothetical protein
VLIFDETNQKPKGIAMVFVRFVGGFIVFIFLFFGIGVGIDWDAFFANMK